jgi:hypothetical protein
MRLSFTNSDKELVVAFILFSLTFFIAAMIALFIVIYSSDAKGLFQENQPPSISQLKSEIRLSPADDGRRQGFLFPDH